MADWRPPRLAIRVSWDAARAEQVAQKVFDRPAKRPLRAWAWGAGAGALACAAIVVALSWPARDVARPVVAGHEVRFHDGSVAFLQASSSDLRVDVADDRAIVAALVGGRAHFDVVRRPQRTFRLQAGDVVVEVIGTAFSVERLGSSSRVAVTRGRVRVSWPGAPASSAPASRVSSRRRRRRRTRARLRNRASLRPRSRRVCPALCCRSRPAMRRPYRVPRWRRLRLRPHHVSRKRLCKRRRTSHLRARIRPRPIRRRIRCGQPMPRV